MSQAICPSTQAGATYASQPKLDPERFAQGLAFLGQTFHSRERRYRVPNQFHASSRLANPQLTRLLFLCLTFYSESPTLGQAFFVRVRAYLNLCDNGHLTPWMKQRDEAGHLAAMDTCVLHEAAVHLLQDDGTFHPQGFVSSVMANASAAAAAPSVPLTSSRDSSQNPANDPLLSPPPMAIGAN